MAQSTLTLRRSERRRIDRVVKFIGDMLEHYEDEEDNWFGLTVLSIVRDSVASLATYAQDVSITDITWQDPFALWSTSLRLIGTRLRRVDG